MVLSFHKIAKMNWRRGAKKKFRLGVPSSVSSPFQSSELNWKKTGCVFVLLVWTAHFSFKKSSWQQHPDLSLWMDDCLIGWEYNRLAYDWCMSMARLISDVWDCCFSPLVLLTVASVWPDYGLWSQVAIGGRPHCVWWEKQHKPSQIMAYYIGFIFIFLILFVLPCGNAMHWALL